MPLGNSGDGIGLSDSGDNTIGGTAAGAGNVISANGGDGIFATSEIFGDNLIEGNLIGTDITGTHPAGQCRQTASTSSTSRGNTIGGTTASRRPT